mgnify:CR=1 FL=1
MEQYGWNQNVYAEKMLNRTGDDYKIDPSWYEHFGAKRGLRDKNGKGVVAGVTNISQVKAVKEVNGVDVPCDGLLLYRGYNVKDLVRGVAKEGGFGFESTAYLLLFGELPNAQELKEFQDVLGGGRSLPTNFVRDVIMKASGKDIMNSMMRSVLTLASYDDRVNDLSPANVLRQCLMLISVFPLLAVYGYQAYRHYSLDDSLYIHRSDPSLSEAENLLRLLRPDMRYTELEAKVLDAALMLHMEHGGGNNSTFTTRVVTSSGSDTYATIAAALASLKGHRHGGANIKVVQMMQDIKEHVRNPHDEEEVAAYLTKILKKEAFDGNGLIYGIGHAIYSKSDPRAQVFHSYVEELAQAKGRDEDYALYTSVEKLGPELINENRKMYKGVSPNVDFYSGFVYSMLGIPLELYTPIFAVARIVGWSAHRMEELLNIEKIIRPAYKSIVLQERPYVEMKDRK